MIEVVESQDSNMELMLDEIEFGWCIGLEGGMNPKKAMPLERLYPILSKHIPQFRNFINKQDGDSNTGEDTSNSR